MSADPFSDVLKLVNAETVASGGFTAGGAWAIQFPAMVKMKFFALVKGCCWLSIHGQEAPLRAETGDVFLISAQQSFVLASDLAVAPVDATGLFSRNGSKFATLGDGDDCMLMGGFVRLDPASGGLLADGLPPLIHVGAASAQAPVLRWLLDQFVREREDELPGGSLASTQLAQLMFIQILRAHLDAAGGFGTGWLRALGDRRLAPALRLMHGEPGRPWKLEELARAAAMSRTTFALHFKTVAGLAPLAYLTAWRMRLAERALREDDVAIAVLAESLGYASESAFGNAFKRVSGKAPKRYRVAARAVAADGVALSP
jgi:AraC-like DNA-binding protein